MIETSLEQARLKQPVRHFAVKMAKTQTMVLHSSPEKTNLPSPSPSLFILQ